MQWVALTKSHQRPRWPRGLTVARFALRNFVTHGRDQSIGKVTYTRPDVGQWRRTRPVASVPKVAPFSCGSAGLDYIRPGLAKGRKFEESSRKRKWLVKCSQTAKSTSAYYQKENVLIVIFGSILSTISPLMLRKWTTKQYEISCTLIESFMELTQRKRTERKNKRKEKEKKERERAPFAYNLNNIFKNIQLIS